MSVAQSLEEKSIEDIIELDQPSLIRPDKDPPKDYDDMLNREDAPEWRSSMDTEIAAWRATNTFEEVRIPKGANLLDSTWVFREKDNRKKARLCMRGFRQVKGRDYDETYSAVACLDSLRMVIALCCSMDWELDGMDVQHAYLYGELDFPIFMRKPRGFEDGPDNTCWKLMKAVYGTKQGGRCFRLKSTTS